MEVQSVPCSWYLSCVNSLCSCVNIVCVCLFVCLFDCLFVCVFVCVFVCLGFGCFFLYCLFWFRFVCVCLYFVVYLLLHLLRYYIPEIYLWDTLPTIVSEELLSKDFGFKI